MGHYRPFFFCFPKERTSRFRVQSCLILNMLTRMSSLVTLEDKQKSINAATLQSLKLLRGISKQRPVTFEGLGLLIYSSIRDARCVKNVS